MSLTTSGLSSSALTALTEAATAISSTIELGTVLSTIAELARGVARAEASSVLALEENRKELTVAAVTGHWREALIGRRFDAGQGIAGHVVRTGEPMLVPQVRSSPRFSREVDELSSTRTLSMMAAPMIHGGEVVGVIEVVNRRDDRSFSEVDLKLLTVFATFATSAINNARVHEDLKQRFAGLRDSVMRRTAMIGASPHHQKVLELCKRVAGTNSTVLLLGETGTGKEVTARYVHNLSRRRDENFVAVNCAALPEPLLESELFGHEKGAFTGAHAQRRGWFEVADGGTLLLDEIGEVSRAMQAKLLRVLQEKRVARVGGTTSLTCDTRVIAATNRNLKNMMIDGLFREDLYYRLSVFPIQIPALRERVEDIPLFVEHFTAGACRDCGIRELRIAPATLQALLAYPWPGNIRELQNVLERAVLMADGPVLLPDHLPPEIGDGGDGPNSEGGPATLHDHERALIIKSLEEHGWNQSHAARALGISRYLLRHRMKKYQIQRTSNQPRDGAAPPN